ncbi:DUF6794 domain-containing protein [Aequorivita sp. KMM 9714]|uniref:DUF6794 domain-containing protein n=1 Tax=Aequorivita sp. KMM 9714 TaxID=2707173 RepID=UPI0013EA725A|nr:DUF6794 domain-containing protein [Aequorivita sp. KMM 9714]NGX84876.1 hypothetical protein [Aequorivita sp. KMM 9714]
MKYEIKAKNEPLFFGGELKINNTIFLFCTEQDQIHHYRVKETTPSYFLAEKMAVAGVPVSRNERDIEKFTAETFDNYKIYLINDKTNDQDLWPRNIKEALIILKSLYTPEECSEMQDMTWEQFDKRFNQIGGLSHWIRNYFGLYRGNFDLALDFDIEEPCADNVSSILVYYFWEYLKDEDQE